MKGGVADKFIRRGGSPNGTSQFAFLTDLLTGPEVAHSALAMLYNRCSRSENQIVRRLAGTDSVSSPDGTS